MTAVQPQGTSAPPVHTASGVVVIGRNEGERLMACLRALLPLGRPVVYVDSGSSDGSPDNARNLGVAVHQLDPSQPFSAARARNEGAQHLLQMHPRLAFLQFLDGDCIMAPGWLDAAEAALRSDEGCALVFGHLQERHPQASVYNEMCALEWRSPSGPVTNFSHLVGITMVRRSVFEAIGGFNARMIAGEDPDFGVRVSLAGHAAHKLDAPMASHDANMHHFSQWWKRSVRAGHAIGQRAQLHANDASRDGVRELRSTRFWGLVVPALIVVGAPFTNGWSLLLLGGYGVLGWRVARYRRSLGDGLREAWVYAGFTVLGKFANAVGLLKYRRNEQRGQVRLIEYK